MAAEAKFVYFDLRGKFEFVRMMFAAAGKDIDEIDLLNLYQCYSHTVNKKWSQEYLTKDFFLQLPNSNLIENTVLISAFLEGKFVGCSVHFRKNK